MQRYKSYRELLRDVLPHDEYVLLPRSFDIIGEIAIIQLPRELLSKASIIGNAILKVHKNVRCVYAKVGSVKGAFRLPHLLHIAGIKLEETTHKEYGLTFFVDIKRCYFSPRLANEHRRIAQLVKDGEYVVDMFSGVGPFAIHIASLRKAVVYAIDINPYAYRCLKRNILLNRRRLQGVVIPICSDAREVAMHLKGIANRVIMNLPEHAHNFLRHAILFLKDEGIIHLYSFEEIPHPEEDSLKRAREQLEPLGCHIEVLYSRTIKEISPKRRYVVLDLLIKKRIP
ncbi:MAG: tRNA (guanine-N1)-methyltransferase [Thermoprotei archaeon]|nr:MAG: tRNA (guanine-N1)-methyltransferase [Thermoprotei archaeon]